ncbi:MAG: hypothetical protein ACPL1Z_00005 [Candidatus Bathyarchaeales archaeon]
MNWKTVLRLISIDIKSSRLIRGTRLGSILENKVLTTVLYVGACICGAIVGWLIGNFYSGVPDPALKEAIFKGATSLFVTFPTLALIYGLVFTQMSQIQRIGAKVSIQPLYWYPITWGEHTLASIIANLIGAPLIITVFICSSILMASAFLGVMALAVCTVLALMGSLFTASITTQIFRVLQVRVSGAVTKVAGRTAVWVRLFGTIIFLIVFYLVYFTLVYGASFPALIESLAGGQRMLWFIPYLWFGITLSAIVNGLNFEAVIFALTSMGFVYTLFVAAVRLNAKFGLYEAPSITISRGVYTPKTGLLGKLGFSSLEAAIMRKDFKAFTRRRELMYIFIMPIVFILMPIISSMRGTVDTMPSIFSKFLFVYMALLPGTLMAVSIGSILTGSEGESIWYVYASPVSAKNYVKAKYFFTVFFSLAVTVICILFAAVWMAPSIRTVLVGFFEAFLLVLALSMASLSFGIKGADFRELPRPRMIRPLWNLINMAICLALALAIISPMIPYAVKILFEPIFLPIDLSTIISESYLYSALFLSTIISTIIFFTFYRINVKNAEDLLSSAGG